VDAEEVEKFAKEQRHWWDLNGPANALHAMNAVRVPFIVQNVSKVFRRDAARPRTLEGLSILDVGCGAGFLSEPLARLGANVTGIDASRGGIEAARKHALQDVAVAPRVKYEVTSAEEVLASGQSFDAVVCSEVVEHVAQVPPFVQTLCALVKPGGGLMMSTLNRTLVSYALSIVVAERVLRLTAPGTHEWSKYVSPEELSQFVSKAGLTPTAVQGTLYNPLMRRWSFVPSTAVNYLFFASKPAPPSA